MLDIIVFFTVFIAMEGIAWWLHKYIMHGPLWVLHEDHHAIVPNSSFEKNDLFAIFFALPSFFSILFGNLYQQTTLSAFGYGIMFYGIAYFFVHEVLIHRRWKLFRTPKKNSYVRAVNIAHKKHHSIHTKKGCENFGMVFVPLRYFRESKDYIKKKYDH